MCRAEPGLVSSRAFRRAARHLRSYRRRVDEETYRPQLPEALPVTCGRCGAAAGTVPPITWMCALEQGTRSYFCETCARAHIRAIEGRLDPAAW